MTNKRPRSVCFTLNNYSDLELNKLRQYGFSNNLKYLVFQLERGSSGTAHIQGYASAHNPKTFDGWKSIIGARAHIESARGTAEENKAYCTKPEGRDATARPRLRVLDSAAEEYTVGDCGPYEFGLVPKQGLRSDLDSLARAAADPAKSMLDVFEANPEGFLKYSKGVNAIRGLVNPRRSEKTRVVWFYGPTGTGKSRVANEIAPTAYWKAGGTKWWCGYQGDLSVIIDDYRRDLCTFHQLLTLLDRYPCLVENKGGSAQFVSNLVIITSPKSPEDTWEGRTDEDLMQLARRIEVIVRFGADGTLNLIKGELHEHEREAITKFYTIV